MPSPSRRWQVWRIEQTGHPSTSSSPFAERLDRESDAVMQNARLFRKGFDARQTPGGLKPQRISYQEAVDRVLRHEAHTAYELAAWCHLPPVEQKNWAEEQ